MTIKGIKLIHHNATGVNEPDDESYPYKLDASFSPPEFMNVAFVLLHGGSETIRVIGKTRKALEKLVTQNDLRNHPRLRELNITEPE